MTSLDDAPAVYVDPFLGAGAVYLRLLAPDLVPFVSWMGGKRKLAGELLRLLGLRAGHPVPAVLGDACWWGWVWAVVLDPVLGPQVSDMLRFWRDREVRDPFDPALPPRRQDPRDLWFALRSYGPLPHPVEAAAQLLWLQARAASGVPVWWARGAAQGPGYNTGQRARDEARAVARSGPKQRDLVSMDGRGPYAAWQATCRPKEDLVQWRPGGHGPNQGKGFNKHGAGGIIDPGTVAHRIDAVRWRFNASHGAKNVIIEHADATALTGRWATKLGRTAIVYLDPPYLGRTAVVAPAFSTLDLSGAAVGRPEDAPAFLASSLLRLREAIGHVRVALREVLGSRRHQFEVLDAVVEAIMVLVVDDLLWAEWAANVPLHDEAMLWDGPSAHAVEPVAVVNPATTAPHARCGPLALGCLRGFRGPLASFYERASDSTPMLRQTLPGAHRVLAARIDALAESDSPADVAVDLERHALTLRAVRQAIQSKHLRPGSRITGYPATCARSDVLQIADSWARAGARVVLSEAEGLAAELGGGWVQEQLAGGENPEWVTCYNCDMGALRPALFRHIPHNTEPLPLLGTSGGGGEVRPTPEDHGP